MRRNPQAALYMAATMGERLHWANLRRADFAAYQAEVRLARLLAEMARTIGHRTDEGIVIGVGISQTELATMIGIAEATAQKAMRDLRRTGAITTGYRSITVTDIDQLREMGVPADDA
jgi:CRP-like cAMP-binding protein